MLVQDVEILNLLNIMLILFIDVHLISLPTNIGWTNLMQCSWTWKAAFLDLLTACSLVARDENIDRFASVEMASYCCAWIPGTHVFLQSWPAVFFLLPEFSCGPGIASESEQKVWEPQSDTVTVLVLAVLLLDCHTLFWCFVASVLG